MSRKSILSALVASSVLALPGLAPSVASAASSPSPRGACMTGSGAQVYSWAGDKRSYVSLPGESWDNIGGQGWTLSGGAQFESSQLLDGNTGTVLDLPGGSVAITPPVCVTNDFPMARTEVRDVSGSAGVNVYVLYNSSTQWGPSSFAADVNGYRFFGSDWAVNRAFNILRNDLAHSSWARFVLVPQGAATEYQLSNFYVDPRMHH